MHAEINKPIFVVSSPRFGTSILAWCPGHHANFLRLAESNWMGQFAVNVSLAYQTGAARGDYWIFSAMDVQQEELFATLGRASMTQSRATASICNENEKRFVQANDQISQKSRQLHDKSVNLSEHEKEIVELTGRPHKQSRDTNLRGHVVD